MIPIKFFEDLKLRIPIELIRDGDIKGQTKLIVIIERFYSVAADLARGCNRLPNKTKIAYYLGECRQKVADNQLLYGYDIYSVTQNGKIRKRDRNKVEIPAVLVMNAEFDVYERLILIDLLAYRSEDKDDVSMEQIGGNLGKTRVYINRYIKSLRERGVLNYWLSPIANAGKICNCYEVLDEPLRRLCIEQLRMQSIKNAIKKR